MNKIEAIGDVIEAGTDIPIIFTTGYSCRIASAIHDSPNHFYMTGSMGLAASIGTGLALSTGLPVVVVDGDGSLAMNLGCLLTAGAMPHLRLLHLVLDDCVYESTGGQPVPSHRADFGMIAQAAGYDEVSHADDLPGLKTALHRWMTSPGLAFVHCRLSPPEIPAPPPRVEPDLPWLRSRFTTYLRGQLTARNSPSWPPGVAVQHLILPGGECAETMPRPPYHAAPWTSLASDT